MQSVFRCFTIVVVLFVCGFASAKQPVKILGHAENAHTGQLFFSEFMNLLWHEPELSDHYQLLEIAEDGYRKQKLEVLLRRKVIDINWAGAKKQLNNQAIKIPLPVVGGLLGYRIALIRSEDAERFAGIASLDDLKAFRACQGETWLDADILEYNGIAVARVSNNQSMVKMLFQGRCDMFPRGIHEVVSELANYQRTFPSVMMDKSLVIQYDFASYLYVRHSDALLAERLTTAFRRVIHNGSYRRLLEEHDYTKHIFPLSQWETARFIYLQNPEPDTDLKASPNYLNLSGHK